MKLQLYKLILLLLFNGNMTAFAESVLYREYDPTGNPDRPYIYGDMKHYRHTKDMIHWRLLTLLKDPDEFLRVLDTFQLDVNYQHKNKLNINYLMAAIMFKEWSLLKPLIDRKINVNWSNVSGETALMFTSLCGYADFVHLLLEAGANPKATSSRGRAIDAAQEGKYLFASNPCSPNPNYEQTMELLTKATEHYYDPPSEHTFYSDKDFLRKNHQLSLFVQMALGKEGALLDGTVPPMTPEELFHFAFKGEGLDVNYTTENEYRDNYLTFATTTKNWEYIDPLISHDINIDWQNGYGETALMHASFCGHAQSVRLLLDANANSSIISSQGHTALDMAKNGQQLANLNCKSPKDYETTIKLLTNDLNKKAIFTLKSTAPKSFKNIGF